MMVMLSSDKVVELNNESPKMSFSVPMTTCNNILAYDISPTFPVNDHHTYDNDSLHQTSSPKLPYFGIKNFDNKYSSFGLKKDMLGDIHQKYKNLSGSSLDMSENSSSPLTSLGHKNTRMNRTKRVLPNDLENSFIYNSVVSPCESSYSTLSPFSFSPIPLNFIDRENLNLTGSNFDIPLYRDDNNTNVTYADSNDIKEQNLSTSVNSSQNLWNVVKPNFNFLMGQDLIKQCKEADGFLTDETDFNTLRSSYNAFLELYHSTIDLLNKLQHNIKNEIWQPNDEISNLWENKIQLIIKNAHNIRQRYPRLDIEIKTKLDILDQRWNTLETILFERVSKNKVPKYEDLESEMYEMSQWLDYIETTIKLILHKYVVLSDIQNLHDELKEFHKTYVISQNVKVASLIFRCLKYNESEVDPPDLYDNYFDDSLSLGTESKRLAEDDDFPTQDVSTCKSDNSHKQTLVTSARILENRWNKIRLFSLELILILESKFKTKALESPFNINHLIRPSNNPKAIHLKRGNLSQRLIQNIQRRYFTKKVSRGRVPNDYYIYKYLSADNLFHHDQLTPRLSSLIYKSSLPLLPSQCDSILNSPYNYSSFDYESEYLKIPEVEPFSDEDDVIPFFAEEYEKIMDHSTTPILLEDEFSNVLFSSSPPPDYNIQLKISSKRDMGNEERESSDYETVTTTNTTTITKNSHLSKVTTEKWCPPHYLPNTTDLPYTKIFESPYKSTPFCYSYEYGDDYKFENWRNRKYLSYPSAQRNFRSPIYINDNVISNCENSYVIEQRVEETATQRRFPKNRNKDKHNRNLNIKCHSPNTKITLKTSSPSIIHNENEVEYEENSKVISPKPEDSYLTSFVKNESLGVNNMDEEKLILRDISSNTKISQTNYNKKFEDASGEESSYSQNNYHTGGDDLNLKSDQILKKKLKLRSKVNSIERDHTNSVKQNKYGRKRRIGQSSPDYSAKKYHTTDNYYDDKGFDSLSIDPILNIKNRENVVDGSNQTSELQPTKISQKIERLHNTMGMMSSIITDSSFKLLGHSSTSGNSMETTSLGSHHLTHDQWFTPEYLTTISPSYSSLKSKFVQSVNKYNENSDKINEKTMTTNLNKLPQLPCPINACQNNSSLSELSEFMWDPYQAPMYPPTDGDIKSYDQDVSDGESSFSGPRYNITARYIQNFCQKIKTKSRSQGESSNADSALVFDSDSDIEDLRSLLVISKKDLKKAEHAYRCMKSWKNLAYFMEKIKKLSNLINICHTHIYFLQTVIGSISSDNKLTLNEKNKTFLLHDQWHQLHYKLQRIHEVAQLKHSSDNFLKINSIKLDNAHNLYIKLFDANNSLSLGDENDEENDKAKETIHELRELRDIACNRERSTVNMSTDTSLLDIINEFKHVGISNFIDQSNNLIKRLSECISSKKSFQPTITDNKDTKPNNYKSKSDLKEKSLVNYVSSGYSLLRSKQKSLSLFWTTFRIVMFTILLSYMFWYLTQPSCCEKKNNFRSSLSFLLNYPHGAPPN